VKMPILDICPMLLTFYGCNYTTSSVFLYDFD
jgi:hypothetical protein